MSELLRGGGIDLMYSDLARDEKFPRHLRSLMNFSSFEQDWSLKGMINA